MEITSAYGDKIVFMGIEGYPWGIKMGIEECLWELNSVYGKSVYRD